MASVLLSEHRLYGLFRDYDYYHDHMLDAIHMGMSHPPKPEIQGPMIKDRPITDKSKAKLAAIDAALHGYDIYLSSRQMGKQHSIWHFTQPNSVDRVFICEWRNEPDPIVMNSPKLLTLKEVLDLIEGHTIYMPAIALDGEVV